jgi:hypothetical protein
MKRLLIVTALALGVFTSSGHAAKLTPEEQHKDYKKYSCIPECPFFSAWAMTKTCRGVSFNERGRSIAKDFSKTAEDRRWSREVVRRESNRYDCRHPGCESLWPDSVEFEDSVCGFLKWKPPLHGKDIGNFERLHNQCNYYDPSERSEEETAKICAAADVVKEKLKAKGYCVYGHGEVGRSSKDKKHCYYLKRSGK